MLEFSYEKKILNIFVKKKYSQFTKQAETNNHTKIYKQNNTC